MVLFFSAKNKVSISFHSLKMFIKLDVSKINLLMELRKVMYKLNSMDAERPGFFHCWEATMQDAYALIEDTTTGMVYSVNKTLFRFIQPPVKQHSKDTTRVEIVNAESISKGVLDVLEPVLKSINEKLKTI